MFAPGPKISRINLKPLLPHGFDFNQDQALRDLKAYMIRQIKANIMQEAYSPQAKLKLQRGFKIITGASSITIVAVDPAFRPLLQGQRQGQMKWLTKARAPIPIVLDSGELIFRSATPRSMENGSWYHPGRKPTTVIEKAKEAAKKALKKKLQEFVRKQLSQALK